MRVRVAGESVCVCMFIRELEMWAYLGGLQGSR